VVLSLYYWGIAQHHQDGVQSAILIAQMVLAPGSRGHRILVGLVASVVAWAGSALAVRRFLDV